MKCLSIKLLNLPLDCKMCSICDADLVLHSSTVYLLAIKVLSERAVLVHAMKVRTMQATYININQSTYMKSLPTNEMLFFADRWDTEAYIS